MSEYVAASPAERTAARAACSRRADSAIRRLRRMIQVEIAEAARARFLKAVKLRVIVDDGDDAWCLAVGIYGPRGRRLVLDNYDHYPQLDRTLQRLVEDAWAEGGKDAWPHVENDDEDDYPLSDDVREIRLPRRNAASAGD
ncbi:hypothetical protein [Micromonospora aurantiaca (nom. illeg.)]|uniref:hypothetical protein n=1 Tax=Micromonospora aurantiaca (nom. illeg.) TaxID=47850 RepID=UPI0033DB6DC1